MIRVPLGDSQGSSRKDKNRLTLIMRQCLRGLFGLRPGELPVGEIAASILLVPCSQPCCLADMSLDEPSKWLRTHCVIVAGERKQRVAGEEVGALLSAWRQLRRDLFLSCLTVLS